ncbi:hypothetical protein [Noviherbaspirillum sp.]
MQPDEMSGATRMPVGARTSMGGYCAAKVPAPDSVILEEGL